MPPTCNLRMLGSHDSATLGCNGSNILLNASNWIIERNWSNRVTYCGSPIDLYRFTCSTECGRRKRFCTLCLSLRFFHNLGVPVSIQQEAKLMTSETSGQVSYLINNGSKTLSMTLRSSSYNWPSTLWPALHLKSLLNILKDIHVNLTLPVICDVLIAFGYSVMLLLLFKHLNLTCRFQIKPYWKPSLLYGQQYYPQDCGLILYTSRLSKYRTGRY